MMLKRAPFLGTVMLVASAVAGPAAAMPVPCATGSYASYEALNAGGACQTEDSIVVTSPAVPRARVARSKSDARNTRSTAPEPGTLFVLGLGLGGLTGRAWRKRRAQ